MTSIESKRVQYRKYLERAGVIDALSRALIKLYEEQNKPEDAIRFVRKHMCESCPDDDQYDLMKADLEQANRVIVKLEQELERLRSQIKKTPEEIIEELEEGYKKLTEDEKVTDMLLKKYLTPELFDEYKGVFTTSNESSLMDCVQAGFENHDAMIGIFAPDVESYDTFEKLFDPIIRDYHGLQAAENETLAKEVDWGNVDEVENLDPERKYILSIRMLLSRNLEGYPFFNKLKEKQFLEIEESIKTAAAGLDGELAGTYIPLTEMDIETQTELIHRKTLFKRSDELLQSAGCYRFWPTARGVYYNQPETFILWVNEEDHLKIISFANCGDLGDVYHRLLSGYAELEKKLQYAMHPRYGFVSANLQNIGTGLKVVALMRLPLLSQDVERCDALSQELGVLIRTPYGNDDLDETLIEVSNNNILGITENEIVKSIQNAANHLIQVEEDIALENK